MISAAESKLKSVRFVDDKPIPGAWPEVRWPAYVRKVNAAPRAAFVFIVWPQDANRAKRLAVMRELEAHGFTKRSYADLVILLPPG